MKRLKIGTLFLSLLLLGCSNTKTIDTDNDYDTTATEEVNDVNSIFLADDRKGDVGINVNEYIKGLYQAWRNTFENDDSFSSEMLAQFHKHGIRSNGNKIFSDDLETLRDQFQYINDKYMDDGGDLLIDSDSWIDGQDYNNILIEVVSAKPIKGNPDAVVITARYRNFDNISIRTFTMIRENGIIVVDDFDGEKELIIREIKDLGLKKYLKGYHKRS